jgi:hypothetical protein
MSSKRAAVLSYYDATKNVEVVKLNSHFLLGKCHFISHKVGSCSTSLQANSVTNIGNAIHLVTTPPPGFQPRLILHQEDISGFPLAGNTGNGIMVFPARGKPEMTEGVTATSRPREALPVPLHSFPRVRRPVNTPRFHFRFVPEMKSLSITSAFQSDADFQKEVMEQASKRDCGGWESGSGSAKGLILGEKIAKLPVSHEHFQKVFFFKH